MKMNILPIVALSIGLMFSGTILTYVHTVTFGKNLLKQPVTYHLRLNGTGDHEYDIAVQEGNVKSVLRVGHPDSQEAGVTITGPSSFTIDTGGNCISSGELSVSSVATNIAPQIQNNIRGIQARPIYHSTHSWGSSEGGLAGCSSHKLHFGLKSDYSDGTISSDEDPEPTAAELAQIAKDAADAKAKEGFAPERNKGKKK